MTLPAGGRSRVVIDSVRPEIDCGRFPAKRALGETAVVEADAFADGHDRIACMLLHRRAGTAQWCETRMEPLGDDRFRASFLAAELGGYEYCVTAWIDEFATWRQAFERRREAADIAAALHVGAALVAAAAERAGGADRDRLRRLGARLTSSEPLEARRAAALSADLDAVMARFPDRRLESRYRRTLVLVVDAALARFSAWYEFFPRSTADGDTAHGTFRTAASRLRYVAEMGFDVVYLPPIHPIGRTNRKGPNNALAADTGDPGSPWAIGSLDGGHRAVHPRLGTLEDFRAFCAAAERLGIAVALDIAFQASPDHPYVREHPAWFKRRPDGSVQYAENPPKKYEDIYPFDFESEDWQSLWEELAGVVKFWIEQGVRIFRVDNPHTKPFAFWEWLIAEVRASHPDVIFLSEAFARPRVMQHLAKLGFNQSYTYFAWRNTKEELTEYMRELERYGDYFRPNLWPNTPDILHEYLQFGGRPAFMCRAVLAATLSSSYGVYGPPYELLENVPREPGLEEYQNSERYQVRHWRLDDAASLRDFLARLNRVRRDNPALHDNASLRFHHVDNDRLIFYSKQTRDLSNVIIVVANLDPHHPQSGFVDVPLDQWRMHESKPYQMHDLLSDGRYLWHGRRNYVALDPQRSPAHVFRLRRHVGTERDFDYYM
jgi:starch synthase (maltosyl-transferring)